MSFKCITSSTMILKKLQALPALNIYGNEVFYVFLFTSVITVNKYVLSELGFTVPTVFQGWQTLSCVILLSGLIRFKKINNDLQILDGKAISLLLPALLCFVLGIVAGSKALADLPVPVFLAVTNLYPALLVYLGKNNDLSNVSLKVCGSTAVLGTVITIFICSITSINASPFFWLLGHVFFNLVYYVYLNKLNLDLTNTTQIYYRNFFSVVILFPISLYLDVLHLPESRDWQFYTGCFLSGILSTLLQIWTFKIINKPNYLQFEELAKVICSIIAHKCFFANIEPFIWVLIIINFLVCAAFLKNQVKETGNMKSEIILSMPSPPIVKKEELVRLVVI